MNERLRRLEPRRAIVLFPSGLTLANLFFGVFAIVAASRGQFAEAVWYVVMGAICDAFDGRVARMTNSGGRFGEELDSLVDAVTFGLAPAMIMYFAVLNKDGWDWVWSFAFTACAVVRLARFNVVQAGTKKDYFQGLPSPAAGITLATFYWFSQTPLYTETVIESWPWHQMLRIVMAGLGYLMVSNVPYPVVPNLSFRSVRGILAYIFLIGGVSLLYFRQLKYFFPLAMLYVTFGLFRAVFLGSLERERGSGDSDAEDREDIDVRQVHTRSSEPGSPDQIEGVADVTSGTRRRKRKRRRNDPPFPPLPPPTDHPG